MTQAPPARYLMRAKDLVDARYAEPITVDDLAAAAGLSRAHFSRMFTRTFGESPRAYLQTRRLERAAALLRHTDGRWPISARWSGCTASARSPPASPGPTAARRPPIARRCRPRRVHARIPSCILSRDTRPRADSRVARQHTGRRRAAREAVASCSMIKIASAHLWVHDQEVALKFWTEKVGLEVRQDVSLPDVDRRLPLADRRTARPGRRLDRPDGRARRTGDGRRHPEAGARPDRERASRAPCS